MEEPTRHLAVPANPVPDINAGYADPFDIFNMISPSHWVNEFLKGVVGWDVLGYIADSFGGEWAAFAKCGAAFNNLGSCMQDIGVNIQQGAIDLDRVWDGNASDAAFVYFSRLASTVSGMRLALYEASAEYEKAARGVWLLANQIQNVLEAIVDKAIIAAVCAAAGTALVETGVGPVVGYGLAAIQIAQIIQLIGKAGMIIQTAGLVIEGSIGFVMDVAGRGGSLSRYPMPGESYHHPAVKQ